MEAPRHSPTCLSSYHSEVKRRKTADTELFQGPLSAVRFSFQLSAFQLFRAVFTPLFSLLSSVQPRRACRAVRSFSGGRSQHYVSAFRYPLFNLSEACSRLC